MAWSTKYKKSIDCNNPKGFSQKAHCAGRKSRQKGQKTKSKSVNERTMKITEQDRKIFEEIVKKHKLTKESFLANLFARKVKKNLENDKGLQKSLRDADKALEKARSDIESIGNGDKEEIKKAIPQDVRKYLGFDY